MLDKSKLGGKYMCFKCECKFYDMNRPEPLCPRCGADQREDPNPDPRDAFLAKYRWTPPPPPPKEESSEELMDDFEDDLMDDEGIDDLLEKPADGDAKAGEKGADAGAAAADGKKKAPAKKGDKKRKAAPKAPAKKDDKKKAKK